MRILPATIVIPAYNEARRLPLALPEIVRAATAIDAEIIVVDDGSTDETAAVAAKLLTGFREGRVIRHAQNLGKGAAVRTGVLAATGDVVVFMDADLATDLEALPRLLAGVSHSHLAVGSRATAGSHVEHARWHRVAMGRTFNRLVRTFTGVTMRDTQCGFKALRASAAREIFERTTVNGFAFDVEVLLIARRLGLTVVEVPVNWCQKSGSTVRPSDPARMLADIAKMSIRLRLADRPSRRRETAVQPGPV